MRPNETNDRNESIDKLLAEIKDESSPEVSTVPKETDKRTKPSKNENYNMNYDVGDMDEKDAKPEDYF